MPVKVTLEQRVIGRIGDEDCYDDTTCYYNSEGIEVYDYEFLEIKSIKDFFKSRDFHRNYLKLPRD